MGSLICVRKCAKNLNILFVNYLMIEIFVNNNLEKAMRVLKRKLIREGVFKELKSRRFYEKPSEKKKRRDKESVKKRKKEIDRLKRYSF